MDSGVTTQLRDRLIETQTIHAIPEFTEATFLASLRSARMNAHGDLDITLTVPISEKYRAMSLTDAIGIEIIVRAQRKRGRLFALDRQLLEEENHG